MVTASSVIYQVYMLYWFADGFGTYSRFFNITCKLSLLSCPRRHTEGMWHGLTRQGSRS